MISFKKVGLSDLESIEDLAKVIWPPTFGEILSKEQITYMLSMMYSQESLRLQFTEEKHIFYFVQENNINIGYFSYQLDYKGNPTTKIHKLYLLPETQGKGYGKAMIEEVKKLAKKEKQTSLCLNVNRFNKAYQFYIKLGFIHIRDEDIAIGNGHLMEDSVLEIQI